MRTRAARRARVIKATLPSLEDAVSAVEPALARAEMGAQLLFEILLWLLFILSAIPTVQSKQSMAIIYNN